MPITINTNVSAMVAQRNLGISSNKSATSLAKLSSGTRVPSAKDDAAALAVGTGLRADVAALRQAQLNTQQGSALLQVADGSFSQVSDILVRMKSLANQSQSDQISNTERGFLDTEFQQLIAEIDRIANTTEFNGVFLLNGGTGALEANTIGANVNNDKGFVGFTFDASNPNITAAGGDTFLIAYDSAKDTFTVTNETQKVSQTLTGITKPAIGVLQDLNFSSLGVTITISNDFDDTAAITATTAAEKFQSAAVGGATTGTVVNIQVGIAATANDSISVTVNTGTSTALGATGNILTSTAADTATGNLNNAITALNTARAQIGAGISRLEFAGNTIAVGIENLSAAQSVLLDVDVSAEITQFTSQQVLIQAGVSMLAQANQQPSLLLRLLQ